MIIQFTLSGIKKVGMQFSANVVLALFLSLIFLVFSARAPMSTHSEMTKLELTPSCCNASTH